MLVYILQKAAPGHISEERAKYYCAFILFGAYTGQQSLSTIAKLSLDQLKEAAVSTPPCLLVKAPQDKVHMEHNAPLQGISL